MTSSFLRSVRSAAHMLVFSSLLMLAACHSYRIPNPTGPPQPKAQKAQAGKGGEGNEAADGTALKAAPPQRNSYDKNGLLKKPKYESRRLRHKVGQREFLGITLPF